MSPESRQPSEPWRPRLYLPAYAVKDAARYAGTSPRTVAYWHYGGAGLGPALPGKERRKPLSYLQLIEVAVVATFRDLGVSLQRMRKARDYLAQRFEREYPFAELDVKTEGHHVLMDLLEAEPDAELQTLIVADAHGQLAWQPLVGDRFAQFDYEGGLAIKWHLAGRESAVLIDPRVSFGAPTVQGIPTRALRGRAQAGEPVEDIVEDFELEREQVLQALRFEGVELAA